MLRAGLALVALVPLAGCATDFCVPEDRSRATFLVNPEETGRNGTSNQWLYGTIQEALDAADADVPSTVCVAAGTYYEQLTVRANVRILGEETGDVLIRPPETNLDALPSAVDQTLLTVLSGPEGTASVERVDVGGAAICADVSGGGDVNLEDIRITGCGLGLRASGGTLSVTRVPIKNHTLQGAILTNLDRASFTDVELFNNGGVVAPGADVEGYERAAALSGVSLGGSLQSRGVDDLRFDGLHLEGDRWTDSLVRVEGGALTVSDSRIDLRGLARGGGGWAIDAVDADVSLRRLTLDGQGHGLLQASGEDVTIGVSNVAWRDDQPLEDPDAPGDRPAILQLDTSSSAPGTPEGQAHVALRHVSIHATAPTQAIAVGADDLDLLVFNSVIHGVGDGGAISGPATVGLGWGYTLTDDSTVVGDNLLQPGDDAYGDPAFDDSRFNTPAADSPVRCAGINLADQARDLRENPRPFEDPDNPVTPAKNPDLGAIELQEPCP